MKLLVTGAHGFVGRYVVTEAIRRGHEVRALVRPSTDVGKLEWYGRDRVSVVRVDLRARRSLAEAVRGVECVIHLAATKSGDMYAQYAGTVVATENLLAAMTEAGAHRLVHVSSFSVYDCMKARSFAKIDEDAPLEIDAFDRDEYAHTKLVQERLVRDHAGAHHWELVVLRPGVIWGKDNLYNARLGMELGSRVWVRIGAWAQLGLTYVENCAEAIVLAAESKAAIGQTLNIVDDEQPTQRRYARLVRRRLSPPPIIIPIPFALVRMFSGLVWTVNKRLFRGRAKIPGIFVPARLDARCKAFLYPNARVKQTLGWKPRYGFAEALDRSTGMTSTAPRRAEPTRSSSHAGVAPAGAEVTAS